MYRKNFRKSNKRDPQFARGLALDAHPKSRWALDEPDCQDRAPSSVGGVMSAPIPTGFDPAEFPIIATHFYGVDLREVRAVFWDFARFGHRLPTEPGIILIEEGGDG